MYYPRVLVVANNSFSNTDNNGRTLGNLFKGWPKEKLAQFCISSDGPNFDICNNYYCITDKEMLNAFLHFKRAQGGKLVPLVESATVGSRGEGRKTLFMMFIRNLVWGKRRWKSTSFMKWVKEFNPEIIVLFFGESTFMLNIGSSLSQLFNAPIVMFNTEGYYFFKKNYYRTKTCFDWLWFPIVQGNFRRQVRKTMNKVVHSVYLNEMLREDYDNVFGEGKSSVLYTSSTMNYEEHEFNVVSPVFSYIGNLTFDRPEALMEVADVLQSINPSYKLNIYGKPLDDTTKQALINHPGVAFKGFVKYDEVQTVIKTSDVIVHAESSNKRWSESLKYGFSTKVADSIYSGSCFLLYAPADIACVQYVRSTGAGWTADNKEDLKKCIDEILFDFEKRKKVLNKAKQIAETNHNQYRNSQLFQQVICNSLSND